MTTRRTPLIPLALAALAAACGDREAVPSAEAKTPPPAASAQAPQAAAQARCDPDNGGLTLPRGFCATVFAEVDGGPRHVAVGPNGDVYAAEAAG